MKRGRSSALTDFTLGMRMSVSGGRSGWARLGLIATGLGIGISMLLLVASLPNVLSTRAERDAARYPDTEVVDTSRDTTLVKRITSDVPGDMAIGYLVQPEGPDAPLPPGVDRVLAPGEALLSPELKRVLESPEGTLLEGRWGDRVVGTIAPEGLVGPREMYVYVGTDQLSDENAERISQFGRPVRNGGTDSMTMLMALVGLVGLLVPVAGFIATAVRFGGESRDRRLAAVRLAGADSATTRRIAAGETLVGAAGGLVVGTLLFLVLRAIIPPLVPPSLSFHGADLRPLPALAALVVVLVPVAAVLVTRSALKHVIVEPLGVVRRGNLVHRRLWWRVAVPVVGLALMALPLLGGGDAAYTSSSQPLVLLGMTLLLIGVSLLLPWLLDVTVRRLRPGALPWDLAVRRLQHESGTAVRAVSAVVVSVASLIAVHGLLGSEVGTPGSQEGRFEAVVYDDLPGSDGSQWAPALAAIDGVTSVETRVMTLAEPVADGEPIVVVVGTCAAYEAMTGSADCTDGTAMVLLPDGEQAPTPGTEYRLGAAGSGATTWELPADTVVVPPAYPDSAISLFVTPKALGDAVVVPSGDFDNAIVTATLDRTVPDVTTRVQTAVAQVDPTALVMINDPEATSSMATAIRQGLMVGTVALLAVVGANLLVTTAEQLRERRRPFAVLTAFGVRRRVLGLSVLFQVAVPVAIGLGLAIAVGSGLSAMLQAGASVPVSLDLAGIGVTAGGAAAVVLLATAALLPMLGRVTRPAGLQGE